MAPPKKLETRVKLVAGLLTQLDIELKAIGNHPSIYTGLSKVVEDGLKQISRIYPEMVKIEKPVSHYNKEIAKTESVIANAKRAINDLRNYQKERPQADISKMLTKHNETIDMATKRLKFLREMEKEPA
jgi:hypothetical protein